MIVIMRLERRTHWVLSGSFLWCGLWRTVSSSWILVEAGGFWCCTGEGDSDEACVFRMDDVELVGIIVAHGGSEAEWKRWNIRRIYLGIFKAYTWLAPSWRLLVAIVVIHWYSLVVIIISRVKRRIRKKVPGTRDQLRLKPPICCPTPSRPW